MFDPLRLVSAAAKCFVRGVQMDGLETDAIVCGYDLVYLLRVLDAANRYREVVDSWHSAEDRSREYHNLCDMLDAANPPTPRTNPHHPE